MAENHIVWYVRYYPWHDGISQKPMGVFNTREEAEKRLEEIKVEMEQTWATPDPDGLRIEPANVDN